MTNEFFKNIDLTKSTQRDLKGYVNEALSFLIWFTNYRLSERAWHRKAEQKKKKGETKFMCLEIDRY